MHTKSAVVVVVDRLGAGYLGPYGNTWLGTPHLNRLASQSFVADPLIIDTPDLDLLYRSYCFGRHAMHPGDDAAGRNDLAGLLNDAGVPTVFCSDEPVVLEHPLTADRFDRSIAVDGGPGETAGEIETTGMARLFAQAAAELEASQSPGLLWIHARGMEGPWDAPLELRNQFAEEDDPLPPESVEVPSRVWKEEDDPDVLLGIEHAYAGQVRLLDSCIGALLGAIRDSGLADQAMFLLKGARGFPLGMHGSVGDHDAALYGELVHVPLIVKLPEAEGAMCRSQTLLQPSDMFATLLDWFGLDSASVPDGCHSLLPLIRGHTGALRDRACAVSNGERAIQTSGWYLRDAGRDEDSPTQELFVKPDDRWEVNEISDRCPEIAEQLVAALDEFEAAAAADSLDQLAPLPPILVEGVE